MNQASFNQLETGYKMCGIHALLSVNKDDETLRTTIGNETDKTRHIFPNNKQLLGQYLYTRMAGIHKLMYAL